MNRLLMMLGLRKRTDKHEWIIGSDYATGILSVTYYCTTHNYLCESPTDVQKHVLNTIVRKVGPL